MTWRKIYKLISNVFYVLGAFIILCLVIIGIFGSNVPINSSSMLLFTWKESTFMWLGFGALPMLLACLTVYNLNDVKASIHKNRNLALIFLPGFICLACALFIVGVILIGMINTFILSA